MKFLAIFVIGLFAGGVYAVPGNRVEDAQGRFIDGIVASALEEISNRIREAGYDPYNFEGAATSYALPVPSLLNIEAFVDKIVAIGASDIVINNINYSIWTSRLTFDISLPALSVSVSKSGAQLTILNGNYNFAGAGSIAVTNFGVSGQVRVSIGILSGVTINDPSINIYLGSIDSRLSEATLFSKDYAEAINNFLNVTLYNALKNSSGDINELINLVVESML